jgi:hypothetical protein
MTVDSVFLFSLTSTLHRSNSNLGSISGDSIHHIRVACHLSNPLRPDPVGQMNMWITEAVMNSTSSAQDFRSGGQGFY